MHPLLKPWSPTPESPWDFDAALHLWRRAGFSASSATVRLTLKRSPALAVKALVDGPEKDVPAAELDAILEAHLAEQVPPRWPPRGSLPVSLDKHLNEPESPDDEFVYYPN